MQLHRSSFAVLAVVLLVSTSTPVLAKTWWKPWTWFEASQPVVQQPARAVTPELTPLSRLESGTSGAINSTGNVANNAVQSTRNFGSNSFGAIKSLGKRVTDGTTNAVKTVGSKTVEGAKAVGEGTTSGVKAVGGKATDGAQAVKSTVIDRPLNAVKTIGQEQAQEEVVGARIVTSKGTMVVELYPNQAPMTVTNFRKLAENGFYNGGMVFHRVVPGFVIQTGDPTGTGYGGSEETIPLEVKNKLSHNGKGVLAMARSMAPDSASSQFYITIKAQPSLDGKYAVFGRVIQGLDVIDQVRQGDSLFSVEMVNVASVQPEEGAAPMNSFGNKVKNMFRPNR